jgi:hypothetical protein
LNHDKSIQENIILEQFRKNFPDFPNGRLFKSESPDFILMTTKGKVIGIELTALPSLSYTLDENSILNFLDDFSHSLSKKQKKLVNYQKQHANGYWLIIFADSIEANGFDLNAKLVALDINSGFERIFLFELFNGFVWPLNHHPKGLRK